MDKDLDPDYHRLRRYLTNNDAPQLFFSALERLIERAGVRVAPDITPPPPKHLPKPRPLLSKPVVEHYAKTMSDRQIADVFGIDDVKIVTRFIARHRIRRRKSVPHKPVEIGVIKVREDKRYPVPVHIITPAYAEATTAHR